MPVFKYNGEKREMRNCYGYDFSDHRPVTIPDEDVFAIRKFSGNSHFDMIEGDMVDPDANCDFAVFRVQGNGESYAKPDRVFSNASDAQEFMTSVGDGKERLIKKRTKA